MLRMLRQPRYIALSALMLVIAVVCVLLGTWQISRLEGKVSTNDALRNNAHHATTPVADVLPVVGSGPSPRTNAIEYRTVEATGTYDTAHAGLVRQRTVNSDTGFLVVTPLRTGTSTLLVVRGFISATSSNNLNPTVPAPPTGTVTVTVRVQPGETRADDASTLPDGQLESINPAEQAQRLGTPVYAGYGELLDGQPGTAGLVTMPPPDLSNPAGGAVEPQHVAYIIQWYLFAALALAAPFAMVRTETRIRAEHDIDEHPPVEVVPTAEEQRAARMADRYGRAAR